MPDDATPIGQRVTHAALIAFIASAYRAAGVPPADAQKAAELMAQSDMSGADGHGVFRLPQYVRRMRAGGMNPRAELAHRRRTPGHGADRWRQRPRPPGDVHGGADAIAKARTQGVGWVGARNGNHAGPAGALCADGACRTT